MSDFARTPGWLYGRVGLSTIAVCGAFARRADYESWIVDRPYSLIAKDCDVSEDTIARHAAKLVQVGALTVIRDKSGTHKTYRVEMKEPTTMSKPTASVRGVGKNTGGSVAGGTDRIRAGGPSAELPGDPPQICGPITERETRGESEGSPLSNLSGESEPITAEAIEKRLGLPGGGWKVLRQWFARDCTFDRWIEFQHAETNPEAFEALLADWSKRDPADRSRPAPNGLRVQLEAGPLRYYRDELRRQAHHARQRQAEREADEAAKRRNGGGHLPAEARRALRAQLGFLAAEDAEGEAETQRREHRPSEQGLTPVAI